MQGRFLLQRSVRFFSTCSKRLQGKVAIVTGGSSGIGAATVKTFAQHGAKVILADVNDKLGEEMASKMGPDVHYVHCDVSKESQVSDAVNLAVSKYGSLDIMFNNAGVCFGPKPTSSFAKLDMEELNHVFSINVKGVAHGVKHAARVMIPQQTSEGSSKRGSIISTCSISHLCAGLAFHPYTVSKHAIFGITRSAASELAHYGIRVNSISPGGVKTGMPGQWAKVVAPFDPRAALAMGKSTDPTDLRKDDMEPQEIANAALFLGSDESTMVNCVDFVVDGGASIGGLRNMFKAIQSGHLVEL